MPVLSQRFLQHHKHPETKLLIVGTFNPDIPQGPDFFYGRPKNYLWELLPQNFGDPSLKNQPLSSKQAWMAGRRIDFTDLIETVDVEVGEEGNVDDVHIDSRVTNWADVTGLIDRLPQLSAVFFTRKTFGGVPNIQQHILQVRDYALASGIYFACLETPARCTNAAKQAFWCSRLIDHRGCQPL